MLIKDSCNLPLVEISYLPMYSYFEWFILGFYELERKGIINLKFTVDFVSQVSRFTDNKYILYASRRIFRKSTSYTLLGSVKYKGVTRNFCIDCADSPFSYNLDVLESVDTYFKIQCPISFDKIGFPLTKKINIPYSNYSVITAGSADKNNDSESIFFNVHKIKPLMLGPRLLSRSISYKALKNGYDHYMMAQSLDKSMKLMCYFGNAKGPIPSVNITTNPDFNKESDILGFYGSQINHPNEKRKIACDIINSLGAAYSGRLINESNSDSTKSDGRPDLVVPLKDFCSYISTFEYNLNISGYRRSIPNRFIESFMVGTAILTDALQVKWYQPFGCEVLETVEMGYEPMDDVDWPQFQSDLLKLPLVKKEDVIYEFESKWKPEIVVSYLINTVIDLS